MQLAVLAEHGAEGSEHLQPEDGERVILRFPVGAGRRQEFQRCKEALAMLVTTPVLRGHREGDGPLQEAAIRSLQYADFQVRAAADGVDPREYEPLGQIHTSLLPRWGKKPDDIRLSAWHIDSMSGMPTCLLGHVTVWRRKEQQEHAVREGVENTRCERRCTVLEALEREHIGVLYANTEDTRRKMKGLRVNLAGRRHHA